MQYQSYYLKIFLIMILSFLSTSFVLSHADIQQNSFSFNGIDEYVDLGRDNFKPTDALTLEFWIHDDWSNNETIIGNTEGNGCALYFHNNKLAFEIFTNNGRSILDYDPSQLLTGWHHVAAIFDSQYMRLYIDGIKKASKDLGGKYSINGFSPTLFLQLPISYILA